MRRKVLVLGASGFHGSAIVRELHRREDIDLRIQSRRGIRSHVVADVGDLESLRAAVRNADIVVHAVSYVGNDPGAARRINILGTANVVQAVGGRGRIIYLSTASVGGNQKNLFPGTPEVAPLSFVSASRQRAEELVLDSGGTVVRPTLVYGRGDRWFIPGLIRLTQAVGGRINAGEARISTINVETLARTITELVVRPPRDVQGSTYLASNPERVAVKSVLQECARSLAIDLPEREVSVDNALQVAAKLGISPHQISLVAFGNSLKADGTLRRIGVQGALHFRLSDEDSDWYRTAIPSNGLPLH